MGNENKFIGTIERVLEKIEIGLEICLDPIFFRTRRDLSDYSTHSSNKWYTDRYADPEISKNRKRQLRQYQGEEKIQRISDSCKLGAKRIYQTLINVPLLKFYFQPSHDPYNLDSIRDNPSAGMRI